MMLDPVLAAVTATVVGLGGVAAPASTSVTRYCSSSSAPSEASLEHLRKVVAELTAAARRDPTDPRLGETIREKVLSALPSAPPIGPASTGGFPAELPADDPGPDGWVAPAPLGSAAAADPAPPDPAPPGPATAPAGGSGGGAPAGEGDSAGSGGGSRPGRAGGGQSDGEGGSAPGGSRGGPDSAGRGAGASGSGSGGSSSAGRAAPGGGGGSGGSAGRGGDGHTGGAGSAADGAATSNPRSGDGGAAGGRGSGPSADAGTHGDAGTRGDAGSSAPTDSTTRGSAAGGSGSPGTDGGAGRGAGTGSPGEAAGGTGHSPGAAPGAGESGGTATPGPAGSGTASSWTTSSSTTCTDSPEAAAAGLDLARSITELTEQLLGSILGTAIPVWPAGRDDDPDSDDSGDSAPDNAGNDQRGRSDDRGGRGRGSADETAEGAGTGWSDGARGSSPDDPAATGRGPRDAGRAGDGRSGGGADTGTAAGDGPGRDRPTGGGDSSSTGTRPGTGSTGSGGGSGGGTSSGSGGGTGGTGSGGEGGTDYPMPAIPAPTPGSATPTTPESATPTAPDTAPGSPGTGTSYPGTGTAPNHPGTGTASGGQAAALEQAIRDLAAVLRASTDPAMQRLGDELLAVLAAGPIVTAPIPATDRDGSANWTGSTDWAGTGSPTGSGRAPGTTGTTAGAPDVLPATVRSLFSDDFETGHLGKWGTCQAAGVNGGCENVTVDDGMGVTEDPERGRVAQFSVIDGKVAEMGGERSEVRDGGNPGTLVEEGDERWYTWSMKFPADFPDPDGGWNIVMQWHQKSNSGSPPLALDVSRGTLDIGGDGVDTPRTTIGPIRRGEWVDYVLHVGFSRSDGFVEAWENGVQTVPRTSRPTMVDGANYLKMGIYRDPNASGDASLLFDDFAIHGA